MLNTKFSPWPCYSDEEIKVAGDVLKSNRVNYWTGNECRLFEKEFASWINVKHAVAVANGTLALDLALKALNVGPGDEVITTSRTFLATASCIVNAGATPIFSDVDISSQNLTAFEIEKVITKRTKAIIVVHLAGLPAEMDEIMELSKKHNLYVIEDCAQAHGAIYKSQPVGSIGHIGAWSFCQDKIMTTGGEGGMVTTNDSNLWSKMWSYKDHGKSWEAIYEKEHPEGFRWVHESFGTNWRLTEMQAAIGRVQLTKIDSWLKLRNRNAQMIDNMLKGFESIRRVEVPDYVVHAQYKYYFFIDVSKLSSKWNRDRIIKEINHMGVPCFQGSCSEVYLEKAFDNSSFRPVQRLPNAVSLGETSIMLLVHPTLTEEEVYTTTTVVKNILTEALISETKRNSDIENRK